MVRGAIVASCDVPEEKENVCDPQQALTRCRRRRRRRGRDEGDSKGEGTGEGVEKEVYVHGVREEEVQVKALIR